MIIRQAQNKKKGYLKSTFYVLHLLNDFRLAFPLFDWLLLLPILNSIVTVPKLGLFSIERAIFKDGRNASNSTITEHKKRHKVESMKFPCV